MSQSQEISRVYEKLNELNPGVNVEELMYGVDGYYYTIFPTEWNETFSKIVGKEAPLTDSNKDSKSGFAGDPIYSERLWEDFKAWCEIERGIVIKDFNENSTIYGDDLF